MRGKVGALDRRCFVIFRSLHESFLTPKIAAQFRFTDRKCESPGNLFKALVTLHQWLFTVGWKHVKLSHKSPCSPNTGLVIQLTALKLGFKSNSKEQFLWDICVSRVFLKVSWHFDFNIFPTWCQLSFITLSGWITQQFLFHCKLFTVKYTLNQLANDNIVQPVFKAKNQPEPEEPGHHTCLLTR